jgi:hypothetical protein
LSYGSLRPPQIAAETQVLAGAAKVQSLTGYSGRFKGLPSVTGEIASTKSENQTVLPNTRSGTAFHRHPRTSIDSYAKLAQDILRLIIYILMPELRILPSSVLGKLGSVVEKAPFALGDKICKTAHQMGPHNTMNA